VRRELVEIHKDKLTYLIAPDGKKLPVEYRDHQFHPLPPEVLYEFLRNRELDLRMKDFYEMLKRLLRNWRG